MALLQAVFQAVADLLTLPMNLFGFMISWFEVIVFCMLLGLVFSFVRGLAGRD